MHYLKKLTNHSSFAKLSEDLLFYNKKVKLYLVKSIRSQLYTLYEDDMKIIQLFRRFPPQSANIFEINTS